MTASLPDLVRDKWAPLFSEDAFTMVEGEAARVVLTSDEARAVVTYDPRGELDVWVHRHDQEPWQGWKYMGMVGTASVARLLELALHDMKGDPRILQGDTAFYEALSNRATSHAEAWRAYYEGRGPRPKRDQPLP